MKTAENNPNRNSGAEQKPLLIKSFRCIRGRGLPRRTMRIKLEHSFPGSSVRVEKEGDAVKVEIAMAGLSGGIHLATIKAEQIVKFGFTAMLLPRLGEYDDDDHEPDSLLLYLITSGSLELEYLGCVHRDLLPEGMSWDSFREEARRWIGQANWLCDRGKAASEKTRKKLEKRKAP